MCLDSAVSMYCSDTKWFCLLKHHSWIKTWIFLLLQSSSSFSTPLHKVEGRSIYYTVADDDGNVDDSIEWPHLTFNGTSVPEVTEKLKEETELDDIIVCTKNPLNQHLIPLHLHLPPNNTTMRLVVVDANSKGEFIELLVCLAFTRLIYASFTMDLLTSQFVN